MLNCVSLSLSESGVAGVEVINDSVSSLNHGGELLIGSDQALVGDLLGVDATATPEECYTHWYSRIKPGHEDAVNAMVKAMAEGTSVQQTLYPWNHPTRGEIIVRCTGKCVRREDGITVFEGFHRSISEAGNTYTHLADKH